MTEYIEREKDIKRICEACNKQFPEEPCEPSDCTIMQMLRSIPAADVREVKRGKWIPRDLTWGRSYYYCSACEETVDMPTAMGVPMFRYCPNCGADMREES